MKLRSLLAGGTDRKGGGDGPVVVLLHGFGAPGDDLVALHRVLDAPRGTRFVFPAAPLELGYGSRAWWMIDLEEFDRAMREGRPRDLSKAIPEGLPEARALVLDMLEDLFAMGVAPSQTVIGGFSQGAMLSLDVALDRASRGEPHFAGVVQLSGTLLAEDLFRARMPKLKGVPVFQSHGTIDPILPYASAIDLRDALVQSEVPVDFVEFRGGHAIPQEVLVRASAFLKRVLP